MAQTVRIPLVGSFNQRGYDGQEQLTSNVDQRFLNCVFDIVHNPITDKRTIYVQKRPGWSIESSVGGSNVSTGLCRPQTFNGTLAAFGDTNSTLYFGATSVGTITGRALYFTETRVSSLNQVAIKSSDGTGWYFVQGAHTTTAYTADGNNSTTITDIKIAGINDTTGLYPGQLLTAGANIVAGTRIVSVNAGAFTAVLDTATTGGAFNDLAITKEPIAKIIDSDFVTSGTQQTAFVEMDGYLFYAVDTTGNLYNSDLNSVTAYTSTNFLSPNMSPDMPIALARHKNNIICFGAGSKEVFFNAGNASGSPLQRSPQYFDRIGALDQRSVTTLENEVYFVSSPTEGDVGVYQIEELKSKRISTPQVDRIIGNISATNGAIYLSAFRMGGYPYLALSLSLISEGPASNLLLETGDALLLENGDNLLLEDASAQGSSQGRLLLYNIDLRLWSEWDGAYATFLDSVSSGSANQIIATSRSLTTGYIYTIYPVSTGPVYQDVGSAYTMEVRTGKIDLGTSKRKRIKSIRLICDKDSTGTAYLSWSDDDYATWSTPRAFDLTSKEPKLSACGSHKGYRAYKLTHASNSAFRAEALEIEYESEADKVLAKTAG